MRFPLRQAELGSDRVHCRGRGGVKGEVVREIVLKIDNLQLHKLCEPLTVGDACQMSCLGSIAIPLPFAYLLLYHFLAYPEVVPRSVQDWK